jgi:hypothetical protein
MQVHERNGEEIELPSRPSILDTRDFFNPCDDGLVLAKPFRALLALLSATALVASFGLGWVSGQVWPEVQTALGFAAAPQKEVSSPRVARTVPSVRQGSTPKPNLAATLQSPSSANANYGSTIAAAVARVAGDTTGTVSPVGQSISPAPAAALGPLAPAPETKPTTIPGWIVTDVRDGTAVLDGPDGPRMARRGDSISGIGRIESIVRWGNRWVVATSNGLIASP